MSRDAVAARLAWRQAVMTALAPTLQAFFTTRLTGPGCLTFILSYRWGVLAIGTSGGSTLED